MTHVARRQNAGHTLSKARLVGLLIAPLLLSPLTGPAMAQSVPSSTPMNLSIDHSQRIALRGSVGSVIVANPLIADVTVVDTNTLFITGKGYGITEVTVVDAIGRTLFQNQVVVTGGQTGSVRVWRGAQMTEMACASSCSVSIRTPDSAGPAAPTP